MSALSPGDGEAPADSELATLRGAVSVTAPFVPTCENRQRAEQPGPLVGGEAPSGVWKPGERGDCSTPGRN